VVGDDIMYLNSLTSSRMNWRILLRCKKNVHIRERAETYINLRETTFAYVWDMVHE